MIVDPNIVANVRDFAERVAAAQGEEMNPALALEIAAAMAPAEPPAPLTPADELAAFEAHIGQPVPDDVRARYFEAQLYRHQELDGLHADGTIKIKPQGRRVLLRAILQADANVMTMSGNVAGRTVQYDARTCIAHVIEDIGPGVEAYLRAQGYTDDDLPKRGDHCFVLSTVADRVSKTTRAVRYWTVHVDDLSLTWRAPG